LRCFFQDQRTYPNTLNHLPDAWIDESKTVKGYEINHEIFSQIQAIKESDRNQGGYPGAGEKNQKIAGGDNQMMERNIDKHFSKIVQIIRNAKNLGICRRSWGYYGLNGFGISLKPVQ
jgi:hypothetical protein